jgi:hypothetical protein
MHRAPTNVILETMTMDYPITTLNTVEASLMMVL